MRNALEDWEAGRVPENFEENLLEYYREYLDESGNLIPARKKNYEAYIYFIRRILPSVNYEMTDYGNVAKKTMVLSECFTVSDEAFALVMVLNYTLRWIRQMVKKESKKAELLGREWVMDPRARDGTLGNDVPAHEKTDEWFNARWTGSHEGNKCSGWSAEGIEKFSELAKNIQALRAERWSGEKLEEHVKDYWNGTLKEKKERKKQKLVTAFQEDWVGAHVAV